MKDISLTNQLYCTTFCCLPSSLITSPRIYLNLRNSHYMRIFKPYKILAQVVFLTSKTKRPCHFNIALGSRKMKN